MLMDLLIQNRKELFTIMCMEINMTAIGASIRKKQSAADTIQQANEILGLSFSEVAKALGVHLEAVIRETNQLLRKEGII